MQRFDIVHIFNHVIAHQLLGRIAIARGNRRRNRVMGFHDIIATFRRKQQSHNPFVKNVFNGMADQAQNAIARHGSDLAMKARTGAQVQLIVLGGRACIEQILDERGLTSLRRKAGKGKTEIELGGAVFDPVAGTLQIGGAAIGLRNRELRLLELFMNAPGQIFSKQKLFDRLFSIDDDASENAIEVYVGRLRKHLEGSDLRITTLRGLGYRLDHG